MLRTAMERGRGWTVHHRLGRRRRFGGRGRRRRAPSLGYFVSHSLGLLEFKPSPIGQILQERLEKGNALHGKGWLYDDVPIVDDGNSGR